MIEIVEGKGVGAGKSYYVCTRLVTHLAAGGTAFITSNFGINWDALAGLIEDRYGVIVEREQLIEIDADDTERLHEVTRPGTEDNPVLIVLDECHAQLNAADWQETSKKGSKGRDMFNWLTQSRHDDNDLLFVTQNAGNIDKKIKRLVTYTRRVRNMKNFAIPGLCRWPFSQFVVVTVDVDGKTQIDTPKWMWHDKGIFACYRSKVMRGSHIRAGEAIPRKKLRTKKSKSPMLRIAIIAAVCIGVYALFSFFAGAREGRNPIAKLLGIGEPSPAGTKGNAALATAAPGKSAGTVTAQERPAEDPYAYRIEKEIFRGTDRLTFLRTDAGEYIKGEISVRGVVKSIGERSALVIEPDGKRLVIVAYDPRPEPRPQPVAVPQATPAPAPPIIAKVEDRKSFGGWIEADEAAMRAYLDAPLSGTGKPSGLTTTRR